LGTEISIEEINYLSEGILIDPELWAGYADSRINNAMKIAVDIAQNDENINITQYEDAYLLEIENNF